MRPLLAAVAFLTRLPVPLQGAVAEDDLIRSTGWYAVVGLLVGAVAAAVDALAGLLFAPLVRSALAVVAMLLVTGALHTDGLMDCADGLGSGKDRDGMLAVMKDSRVGAMGAIAGAADLLLRTALLTTVAGPRWPALLMAPALGRAAMVPAMALYPSARAGAGLGGTLAGRVGWRQVLLAWAPVVLLAALTAGGRGLAAAGAAAAGGWLAARYLNRRLHGLTGDTYGAVNEVAELCALAAFAAHLPAW